MNISESIPHVDYRTLFEALPGLYLVLLPDPPRYTVVAASDAYLRATLTRREAILGRGMFEVFPDNPDDPSATGVTNLRASLDAVLRDRVPHTMAVQKYDVQRPKTEGAGFEERYWSPVNSPVLNQTGEVTLLVHRVEDVTEFIKLQAQGPEAQRQVQERLVEIEQRAAENLLRAEGLKEANSQLRAVITERKEAETALRESEERFRGLADNIAQLAWIADGSGWIFWYNRRWFSYTGTTLEEMQGWGWKTVHHPGHIDRVVEKFARHLQIGEAWEDTFPLRGKDGRYRWFLSRAFPLHDEVGNVTRWFGTNTDVTEQRETEAALLAHSQEIERLNERLRRSMSETHHRVKNNLQVITALVNIQRMQHSDVVPVSEIERLNQHISALATIHDMLTSQAKKDRGTDDLSVPEVMEKLLPMLQAMVIDRSIRFQTEDVRLPIGQGTALSILLNELVSNAVKHGRGEIGIVFSTGGDHASLQVEDQGPGFPDNFNAIATANTGLELIESLSRFDLQGSICYENRAEGGARVIVEFPFVESPKRGE